MSTEELLQYQSNVGTAILLTLIGIATLFVIVSAIIVWAIGACHYVPKKRTRRKEMDRNNINIVNVEAWANRFEPNCPHGVFGIDWEAENIGFGRLELFFDESGKAHIHSECMDSNDDKRFTKAVLMKMIEDAVVDE